LRTFQQTLAEAEEAAKTDLAAAIGFLAAEKESADFHPWGGFRLAQWQQSSGAKAEALATARQLVANSASFMPAWPLFLDLARGTGSYGNAVRFVQQQVRQQRTLGEQWMQCAFLECALQCPPAELDAMLRPALDGKIVDDNDSVGIKLLGGLVRELRTALLAAAGQATAWRFAFLPGRDAVADIEGVRCVNLARLEREGFEPWQRTLARPFLLAITGLMQGLPFDEDEGVGSMPSIGEPSAFAVLFWRKVYAEATRERKNCVTAKPRKPARIEPGDLWVRVGNVELWALWNHCTDRVGSAFAAERVAKRMQALADAGGAAPELKDEWWPRLSPDTNITRLCTNAGWYARPGSAAAAFSDWADRYAAALEAGSLFVGHTTELLRMSAVLPGMRSKDPRILRDDAFVSALDGARITFVTAFADEVKERHESGALDGLWKDLGSPARIDALETVEPPMSIWPYFPARSWSESFEELLARTSAAIERSGSNLFLASCGAYGLPLVHAIHKRHKITCLYFGHVTNMYFGVYTDAFKQYPYYLRKPDSAHWARPNLAKKFSAVARIDDGRYVNGA